MGCWCGYLSRLFAYGAVMPLPVQNPIISCLIYTQTGFTFLVPTYPGCPGKEAIKRVCSCSSYHLDVRKYHGNK